MRPRWGHEAPWWGRDNILVTVLPRRTIAFGDRKNPLCGSLPSKLSEFQKRYSLTVADSRTRKSVPATIYRLVLCFWAWTAPEPSWETHLKVKDAFYCRAVIYLGLRSERQDRSSQVYQGGTHGETVQETHDQKRLKAEGFLQSGAQQEEERETETDFGNYP